jgi:hypothetical protein
MTADLPPDHLLDTVQHRFERPTVGQTALRMLTAAWLTASVLAIVIWGMLCLTERRLVYPGWIWVVGPVGSALPVLRHYANDSSRYRHAGVRAHTGLSDHCGRLPHGPIRPARP